MNKIYRLRKQVFMKNRKSRVTIKQLTEELKSHYKDLAIPRQEAKGFTRQYDVSYEETSNPFGSTEDSLHYELCRLHDEEYIFYRDRFKYREYIPIKFKSTLAFKIRPDVLYKELYNYCDNPYAVLGEWYHYHKDDLDYHPELPTFFSVDDKKEDYTKIDIIRNEKSNVIVPLSSLYITLKGNLKWILTINQTLLEYQSEWLIEKFGKKERVILEVEQKICGEHFEREHKELLDMKTMLEKGIKPYFEHADSCELCRNELAVKSTYDTLYQLQIQSEEEQRLAAKELLEATYNSDDEYGGQPDEDQEEEQPEANIDEDGEEVPDDIDDYNTDEEM